MCAKPPSSSPFEDNEGLQGLIGYALYDKETLCGRISKVLPYACNPLLELTDDKQHTHLIPAQVAWLERIDDKEQSLFMDLPEGLFDFPVPIGE